MSERLDDLARSLAEPVPRRRALRLIGSAVAAAVLAVRAGPTAARPTRGNDGCGDSAVACGGSSLDCYRPGLDTCCPYRPPHNPLGSDVCFDTPNGVCCWDTSGGSSTGSAWCASPGYVCCGNTGGACPPTDLCCVDATGVGRCCPPDATCCAGGCCHAPFVCVDGRCERPRQCERGETQCGTTCCKNATQFCANAATSTCCQTGERPCTYVQPGSQERITRCCRSGTTCCVPRGGTAPGVCCPAGRCCGGQCCRPNQKCRRGRCCTKCGDEGACCARGEKCCGDHCCKSGETCGIWGSRQDRSYICCKTTSCRATDSSRPFCCPNKTDRCLRKTGPRDANRVCCPPKRVIVNRGAAIACCPGGTVALPERFVVGGGAQGACCPEAQACGSGADMTCCPTQGGRRRACCSGACVDVQFDVRNCGGCGVLCGDLQRCENGICVAA